MYSYTVWLSFILFTLLQGAQQSQALIILDTDCAEVSLDFKNADSKRKVLAELQQLFDDLTPLHIKGVINIIQEYALCGPSTEVLTLGLFRSIKNHDIDKAHSFLLYGADCSALALYNNVEASPLELARRLSQEHTHDWIAYECFECIKELLKQYSTKS